MNNLSRLCKKWFFVYLLAACLMTILNYAFPEYIRALIVFLLKIESGRLMSESVIYRLSMWLAANFAFVALAITDACSKYSIVDIESVRECSWKIVFGLILILFVWWALPTQFHCNNCSLSDDIFYIMLAISIFPGIQLLSYISAVKIKFILIGK